MLEWLRELGSFHRIGSAVVAILPILAAACLGAFLATWLQEWLRVRREHLAAIKAEVFRPLRRELQEFYLPLLSGMIGPVTDRKSTRLNSSHRCISYAVFCLTKNTF